MDEMLSVVAIGVSIFLFLLVLLGIGSFYGGDWEQVAQGVTNFVLLILAFSYGAYVLFKLLGGRR